LQSEKVTDDINERVRKLLHAFHGWWLNGPSPLFHDATSFDNVTLIVCDANLGAWCGIVFRIIPLEELDTQEKPHLPYGLSDYFVEKFRGLPFPVRIDGQKWAKMDSKRSSTAKERIAVLRLVARNPEILSTKVVVVSDNLNVQKKWSSLEDLPSGLLSTWEKLQSLSSEVLHMPRSTDLISWVDQGARYIERQCGEECMAIKRVIEGAETPVAQKPRSERRTLKDKVVILHRLGHGGKDCLKRLAEKHELGAEGLAEIIAEVIGECRGCRDGKTNIGKIQRGHLPTGEVPMQYLSIDVADLNPSGLKLIVAVEHMTRFCFAKVILEAKSGDVIQFLRDICGFAGFPQHLLSDNATYFRSSEMRDFANYHGIRQQFTPIYNPRSNGLVERKIGVIKEALRCAFWNEYELKKDELVDDNVVEYMKLWIPELLPGCLYKVNINADGLLKALPKYPKLIEAVEISASKFAGKFNIGDWAILKDHRAQGLEKAFDEKVQIVEHIGNHRYKVATTGLQRMIEVREDSLKVTQADEESEDDAGSSMSL
jgi:hypothetical protein